MIKRNFTNIIIVAIIAASLMFAGIPRQPAVVSAAPTLLSDYAGIAAYTNIGEITLDTVKDAFLMIEYVDPSLNFLIGTLDLPIYETTYDPLVLVDTSGLIVAFYPAADPAGKIVDVISKNLDETLLEKAVKIVAGAADVVPTTISHYDFRNPSATKLLLVAEYETDGNEFTLSFNAGNTYYEKSYSFYGTYLPSFTLDNDIIDQLDFVEINADYIGTGYFGTIYGHFTTIDFDPEYLNSFAVETENNIGFGSLAILYSGDAAYTAADKDFERELVLVGSGIDPTFDLTPTAPTNLTLDNEILGGVLDPILSWESSTAPNYEYCIDTSPQDEDTATDDCDTEWISVGSETSIALSNLFYETTYYWQVRAINSYDMTEANLGIWASFYTGKGVEPGPFLKIEPVVLKEPIDSLSKVTMSWEESYGAYYYEVCVDTEEACEAPELWHNVGLATSATMGDLLLDSTYYWQVRAVNYFPSIENVLNYTEADGGGWGTFDTRTFSKLRPYEDEVYNITLPFKWEETPIATQGYEYCFNTSLPDEDPLTDDCDNTWKNVAGTSVVVRKLEAGKYYWQVRTSGSKVEANDGIWWEFDVLAKKDVSKITLFKVSPINGAVGQPIDNLGLSWKTTKTAISYQYCFFPIDDTDTTPISDDDTCSDKIYDSNWKYVVVGYDDEGNPIVDFDATSTMISGLTNLKTYLWQVRANIGTITEPDWLYADKGDYWAFTTIAAPLP